jgi:sortase (surface protein transpeptidase)
MFAKDSTTNQQIKKKMPLVVFGSAMFGKDDVRIKGHRHGITNMIFKQLKHRESLGELCLLTIDEYFTSQVHQTHILTLH